MSEETIKFGESATDGELYPVCKLLCYDEMPYAALEVAGVKMTFKVSDAVIEYLAGICEMGKTKNKFFVASAHTISVWRTRTCLN